jgi:hypothetical protein
MPDYQQLNDDYFNTAVTESFPIHVFYHTLQITKKNFMRQIHNKRNLLYSYMGPITPQNKGKLQVGQHRNVNM